MSQEGTRHLLRVVDMTSSLADALTSANLASCPDRRNLMFPLYYAGSEGGVGVYLSPSQVRTLRGSTIYRAYAK